MIKMGEDGYGNTYYTHKFKKNAFGKNRRFCMYYGIPEPSKVPPIYHGWLHYSIDNENFFTDKYIPKNYEKKHLPNLTGTKLSHNPSNSKSVQESMYYRPWKPTIYE